MCGLFLASDFWKQIFLKILYLFLFLEKSEGREKERERETSMCGCLLRGSHWGPGLQPRHVLTWLGIELVTLWFSACAQSTEPGLDQTFLRSQNSLSSYVHILLRHPVNFICSHFSKIHFKQWVMWHNVAKQLVAWLFLWLESRLIVIFRTNSK